MAKKIAKPKKIIRKKVSNLAKDFLGRLNSDILFALNKIDQDSQEKEAILSVARQIIEEEKDYLLSLNSGDVVLSVKHANAKGRIASLTYLIHLIEGAGDEIERREEGNG